MNTLGAYFFMSYAHVPPIEGEPLRGDSLVDTFFADLEGRVKRRAQRPYRRIGLYDKTFEPGRDWGTSVGDAFGEAQVLVALYSQRYVEGPWTMREQQAFEDRIRAANGDPAAHVQPVLWMPFPSGTGGSAASDLGADVLQYQAMGLGALCDVVRNEEPGETETPDEYRKAYDDILDRLAGRIVEVAEGSSVDTSEVPKPRAPRPVDPQNADFVVAIFAPTADQAPANGDPEAYGSRVLDWSPFALTRSVPIVQQASNQVLRQNFTAAVTAAGAHARWARKPTILLVDAWLATDPDGTVLLEDLLKGLPSWVVLLAVVDQVDGPGRERADEALTAAVAMLSQAEADPELAAADGLDRFMDAMPTLIARARRRFFKAMPPTYPSKPKIGAGDTGPRAVEDENR
jgi:FxsC-like protein